MHQSCYLLANGVYTTGVQFEKGFLMQHYTFSFTTWRLCSEVGDIKKEMGARSGDEIPIIPATTETEAGDLQVQSLSGLQRDAKSSLDNLTDHVFL